MLIPMRLIFGTQLPTTVKVQISVLFLLGFFCIIVTILRIVFVLQDLTQSNRLIWAYVECFAGNFPTQSFKSYTNNSKKQRWSAMGPFCTVLSEKLDRRISRHALEMTIPIRLVRSPLPSVGRVRSSEALGTNFTAFQRQKCRR